MITQKALLPQKQKHKPPAEPTQSVPGQYKRAERAKESPHGTLATSRGPEYLVLDQLHPHPFHHVRPPCSEQPWPLVTSKSQQQQAHMRFCLGRA